MICLETARNALAGKSPVFGAIFSSSLGLGVAEMLGANVSTIVIVALCGAAGAFFGCLPRLITAVSGADANSRKLFSQEIKILLRRIHRLELRVVLEQGAKHIIQSEHNNLVVHVKNLEALLAAAGGIVPAFQIRTYEELLGPTDREIKALMLGEAEEHE